MLQFPKMFYCDIQSQQWWLQFLPALHDAVAMYHKFTTKHPESAETFLKVFHQTSSMLKMANPNVLWCERAEITAFVRRNIGFVIPLIKEVVQARKIRGWKNRAFGKKTAGK